MEDRHMKLVKNILSQYPYSFYAFGSRAKGNPKKFSDLDVCFFDSIPLHIQSKIEEDFENSDLPYKVDFVDWNKCSEDFRKSIQPDLVLIT